MSTYIGKNDSNQNIVHMTSGMRYPFELKRGLLDDTVFHSQRPYLTVASYKAGTGEYLPKVGTYMPEHIDDDDTKGYVLSQPAGDDCIEMLEYTGGGGLIDFDKPFIMLCKFRTHSDGWTWVLGHTAPYECKCTTEHSSSNYVSYGINNIKSNSVIEVRVALSSGSISVSDAEDKDLTPSRIDIIQLEHDIDDFDSTKLDGPIRISGKEGIKVGSTNFFNNSYLRFSDSAPSSGNYYEITLAPNKQTYLCLSHIPLSSSKVSINLKSGSIISDNIPIFDKDNIHLRKTLNHVNLYDTTEDMVNSGLCVVKSRTEFIQESELSQIARYWACINIADTFGSFTFENAVIVFLRIKWKNSPDDNPRYKIFNGLYSLGYMTGMQIDLPSRTETFESSGLMIGRDAKIYFIFNAQDDYVVNNQWNVDGNVIPDSIKSTSYVTEVKGWIAEITGGSNIPNNGHRGVVTSYHGSKTNSADESYSTTKDRIEDNGYGFSISNNNTFTSTNKGVDSSFSFIEFTMVVESYVNWNVSSEAYNDKLYIWKNEILIVNEPSSGSEATYKSGSFIVSHNDKVSLAYSKDSTESWGDDRATVTLTKV